jgi:predicted DNA-binding transcriptional regulator AlpA
MEKHDTMLNTEEASKRLRLAPSTLAKLRLSGNGPTYTKLGRRVVYRQLDLESWVETRKFQSTSQYEATGGHTNVEK